MKKPKAKKTHPVPEWMDKDIAKKAKDMDITKRFALADDLERRAAQLRNFEQKRITGDPVSVHVRPEMKKAILYYGEKFGDKDKCVATAARWMLEVACTMLPQIVERASQLIAYRKAEQVEDSHLHEAETAKSLTLLKENYEIVDDDDDDAGEEMEEG